MRRLVVALLLLPILLAATPNDLAAERQHSRYLIEQAYQEYPAIPAGLLESQAWAATRWQHRLPDASESHRGMPEAYGLFGLYGTNDYGFVDMLGAVAHAAGVSREQLLSSEAIYVDSVARFVSERITAEGLAGQPMQSMRPIVDMLSGIAPASDATRYAVSSHAYEVFQVARTGMELGEVRIPAQSIDLNKAFSPAELERLRAPQLVLDAADSSTDIWPGKKKTAPSSAASVGSTEQINVDYPGATWNEAYSFSSRSGSAVTHVVVHTMQGSYAGSIAWFLNPDSQVSAHYLMRSSDGQVTQMVRNVDKAWHARSANPYSVGIEHEGFVDNPDWYTDTMYTESAKLTVYLCTMYAIDCSQAYDGVSHSSVVELSASYTVKGHQHYPDQTHTDPGINWDWPRYHALLNGGVIAPEVNHLPEANFVWSCTALVCEFDASASADSDGAISDYRWEFRAGQVGSAVMPSHTFTSSGDYLVKLAVTDDRGAVHTTVRSVRVSAAVPTPPSSGGGGGGGGALGPWLLVALLLIAGCAPGGTTQLKLPQLADADYYWISGRIFQNETNGQLRYLTHWNEGEDFPSMGIGHFIWFPDGVDAPFDESFPRMLNYLKTLDNACASVPDWLTGDDVPPAPWASKAAFEAAYDGQQLTELRAWLAATAPQQAQYIVASFNARWNALDVGDRDKAQLTALLQALLGDRRGQFAVIDYFNFKGLGSNPRERYAGEGWGLVQVLGDIAATMPADDADLVALFSTAAADRLALRVANSPPERNEQRWLEGWQKRVSAYNSAAHAAAPAADDFRVAPYWQELRGDQATLVWFSQDAAPGSAGIASDGRAMQSSVVSQTCALDYHLAEYPDIDVPRSPPYQHAVTFDALLPGQNYSVEVRQGASRANVSLRTASKDSAHFIVYGDSETEPESSGAHARWTNPDGDAERVYLVDQTSGYAANLAAIMAQRPDFVAIAGDLVESGGEQRDWDEFWKHNSALAAVVPLLPARGNHEYFAGPGQLGGYREAQRAIAKYEAYFARPPYYVHHHGPVALIVLDVNNGTPERGAMDTNWYLDNTAPRWQPGSEQYHWLEETLASAQQQQAFTFVMFHHAPFSSGIHGRTPGTSEELNFSSGIPLQSLTPLLQQYGVDAVFSGHDELYEHSVVQGEEHLPDGTRLQHSLHFFTVGIGGDGLRGPDAIARNPASQFLAHNDAPERWDSQGVLQDGGKHYGHLDVRIERADDGTWQARLKPVYLLPVMNAAGELQQFTIRSYDDALLLESTLGN